MDKNKAGAIVVAVLVGTAACVGLNEKHDEPKETRDPTTTIRSETPYTMNVSYGVTSVASVSALGLEIPKKK